MKNKSSSVLQAFLCLMAVYFVFDLIVHPVFAISTEALRETMKDAKSETFSWMFLVKVAAAAVGSAVAVFKQSPAPFGLGIGTTIGIHIWDKYLGDGSSALI